MLISAVPVTGDAGALDQSKVSRLQQLLADARRREKETGRPACADLLRTLVQEGLDRLPWPGNGETLSRWRMLAEVASHDLSLAKLFEGHTDALAILSELHAGPTPPGSTWGTWAAEPPDARVLFTPLPGGAPGQVSLQGRKAWCSGAAVVSHGLLTVWREDDKPANPGEAVPMRGPWLARVVMGQPGVQVSSAGWEAVGMADSASLQIDFDGAVAELVGEAGDYLARPGFWQGGAGIAACWWGGARALAATLKRAVPPGAASQQPFRAAALGKVDMALQQTAALLRETAEWIDHHPREDASAVATRVRLSAEATARTVLDEVGRALGATPFCRDAAFARMAADLPVFVRQSHADKDFAFLGGQVAGHAASGEAQPWTL
ncbi:MAG: acyl-CoA dehydrogenase [Polaromonas sp.]|nr:acyl-CoA dehydrogenase [Polaromonas sp.]